MGEISRSDTATVGAMPGAQLAQFFSARLARVRERMEERGVRSTLVSHGGELPWLTGYTAMPLERVTLLVLRLAQEPQLLVPALEAPRVATHDDLFSVRPWSDSEDPLDIAADLVGRRARGVVALSDRAWAQTLLGLQSRLPGVRFVCASEVISPIRAVKDAHEIGVLRDAAQEADRVAAAVQSGEVPFVGRTESEVADDIGERLIAEGHDHVNFTIVASGPNGASPHHESGDRRIGERETVVCDFGGRVGVVGAGFGYCSDITRTVVTGAPTAEIAECYEVLKGAQEAAVHAARAGVSAEDVDAVARSMIDAAGYGKYFIHRTGHGIGIDEHEEPYIVAGNATPLVPGNAFSIEPGIYVPGRFGMRIEDIVVATDEGPVPLNEADHSLAQVS